MYVNCLYVVCALILIKFEVYENIKRNLSLSTYIEMLLL